MVASPRAAGAAAARRAEAEADGRDDGMPPGCGDEAEGSEAAGEEETEARSAEEPAMTLEVLVAWIEKQSRAP